ncbi:hypothetical protein [Vibrio harveyi]|uniref:hypothetical protein n=1 Tax=Vibrio harveyi TaxID=669 RepID=UPI003CF2EC7A
MIKAILLLCAAIVVAPAQAGKVNEGKRATSVTSTEGGICTGASHYIKFAFTDKNDGVPRDESILINTSIFEKSQAYLSLPAEQQYQYRQFIIAITHFVYDGDFKTVDGFKDRFMVLCTKATKRYTQ